METRRPLILLAVVLGVLLSSTVALRAYAAFTQPSTSPPNGDAYAPLNDGPTAQTKTGSLTAGGLISGTTPNPTWGNLIAGTLNTNVIYAYGRMCVGNTLGDCTGTGGTIINATGVRFPDGTLQTTAIAGGSYLPLSGGTLTASSNVNFNGAATYGIKSQHINVDTLDTGVTSDPLEVNYYTSGPVKICASVGCATYSAIFNTDKSVSIGGDISFAASNPYLSAPSYVVVPGGAYFNSGTVYTEAAIQARGGIHNDSNTYLTISGGTSGNTYFSGNVGVGTASPNGRLEIAQNPGNGYLDGMVLGQVNADNSESIQTYIDAGAGGGWATRATYNGGAANLLYIQKDAGDLILGNAARGVSVTGTLSVGGTAYANGYALCQSNGTNCPAIGGSPTFNSIYVTGAITGTAYAGMATLGGGGNSWYGMGSSDASSGATPVGGYYPYAISNHTGLAFSAHSAYGGIRFYNQNYPSAPLGYLAMQIINNNVSVTNTLTVGGTAYANGYALCQSNGTNCPAQSTNAATWNGYSMDGTFKAHMGFSKTWTDRTAITGDQNYWTGSQGWGAYNFNTDLPNLGSGFFDSWGDPANEPPGTSHWQGVQGYHYWNGSTGYGFQLASCGPCMNGTAYIRNIWGGGWSGWYKILTSNNMNVSQFTNDSGYLTSSGSYRQFNTWQNNHYSGTDGAEYATIFYDTNNSGYYIDPAYVSVVSSFQVAGGSLLANWPGYPAGIQQTNGAYFYPGFLSGQGSGWNTSYYLAGSTSWGLYTNTSMYSAGGYYAPGFYYSSDQSLKEHIVTIPNALESILKLRGVTFDWKADGKPSIGLVAQEVEKVYPELVNTNQGTGLKSVEYGNLVGPLIEAVKELAGQVSSIIAEVSALKDEMLLHTTELGELKATVAAQQKSIDELQHALQALNKK